MKKLCITFFVILIIVLSAVTIYGKPKSEYLRIHIRANSNSQVDQQIKYQIKDLVVFYLTPLVENCKTFIEAIGIVKNQKTQLNGLIDGFLAQNGFNYRSKVEIKKEHFPTREYEGKILAEGIYDAVIISLGLGLGDNWWCVVYPPLCFNNEKVTYNWLIVEFFKRLKGE